MLRGERIKTALFGIGSLTADSAGLFDIYGTEVINGTIQSISIGSNIYTNTGSIAIYSSGTDNTVQQDLIIRFRAGSMMTTFHPHVIQSDNQAVLGSFTNVILNGQFVMNAPIRIVGSGLGNGTSGLYLEVRYI